MNTYSKSKLFLVAATIVCLFLTAMTNPTNTTLNSKQLDAKAKQIVSERYYVPLDVIVVAKRAQHLYPTYGLMVHAYKIRNKIDGKTYGIALDQVGIEVNEDELLAAEFDLQGRIDPQLANKLSIATNGQRLEVVIWLKEAASQRQSERPSPDVQMSQEQVNAYLSQADTASSKNATSSQMVVDKLTQAGIQGAKVDPYSPVVYAELSANTINEVSMWPEVEMIYAVPKVKSALEIARATTHANTVQNSGINGTNVKVAVIEPGRIAGSNPYLSGVIKDIINVCPFASLNTIHATGVVGIIKSTHSTRKGIAPGATVRVGGSCTFRFIELVEASHRARAWGARVYNLSWGANTNLVPGVYDRFYDRYVMTDWRTIVVASGNRNALPGSGLKVLSPGLAYNVITVGNFDDKNTVLWPDDRMNTDSSYEDPTSAHSDREKPEVAAPGTNFNSTTIVWPWTGEIGSGTSYASPVVTGTVALMMQRNTLLQVWPESVKAILMATAFHNIEGAARLSDKDGAGGIDALKADRVAANNPSYGGWGGAAYSCDNSPTEYNVSIPLVAGRATRVVIAWNQNPGYTYYASKPSADLDLMILDPTGAAVASSNSFDNTHEIVFFVPTTTGNYTLRVNKFRCDLTPEWLGWAYYHN